MTYNIRIVEGLIASSIFFEVTFHFIQIDGWWIWIYFNKQKCFRLYVNSQRYFNITCENTWYFQYSQNSSAKYFVHKLIIIHNWRRKSLFIECGLVIETYRIKLVENIFSLINLNRRLSGRTQCDNWGTCGWGRVSPSYKVWNLVTQISWKKLSWIHYRADECLQHIWLVVQNCKKINFKKCVVLGPCFSFSDIKI